MDYCPNCGVNYDREFDHEETLDYIWVPRCTCIEDNMSVDEIIWEISD